MPHVFSVPFGAPFADTVADFLLNTSDVDVFGLSDVTVWLPSPRQAVALKKSLLSKRASCFLPKMRTMQASDSALARYTSQHRVLPPMARLSFFDRLVGAKDPSLGTGQRLAAAKSLDALFKRLVTAQIDFAKLNDLVPTAYALHWQKNADFLHIIAQAYPTWLAEQDAVDPDIAAREALFEEATLLANDKNILTGFADTTAIGLQVMKTLMAQPNNTLILPGYEACSDVPPTHPQYGMQQILRALNAYENDVHVLGEGSTFWPRVFDEKLIQTETPQITLINAETGQQEAETIALIMREALEQNETCALVTPDKTLAGRVRTALLRWDATVDDSSGTPFGQTAVGQLFLLIGDVLADGLPAAKLAELCHHPLAHFGCSVTDWKEQASLLDSKLLRGSVLPTSFAGLYMKSAEELAPILRQLEQALDPLLQLGDNASFTSFLHAHLATLTNVRRVEEMPPEVTEVDDFLAEFLASWHPVDDELTPLITLKSYMDMLRALLEGVSVRQPVHHPHLFIWGPLEARLQQVDRLVLSGLNETVWPHQPSADMWLNRAMEMQLGLPETDVTIGLALHDFTALAASHKNVFLTRSLRDGDGPTLASRILSRLCVVAGDDGWHSMKENGEKWTRWMRQLRQEGWVPAAHAAEASPPKSVRPISWSASLVQTLVQCPYKTYAKYVLNLKQPEEYDPQPDAMDRGNLIHTCFDAFFSQVSNLPTPWNEEINAANRIPMERKLTAIAEAVFAREDLMTTHVWWPRMEMMIPAFVEALIKMAESGRQVTATEREAKMNMGPVTLTARADRVDSGPEGLVAVDYKTGQLPTTGDVTYGQAPQMAMEALMLERGAFGEGLNDGEAAAQPEFWHLAGGGDVPLAIKRVPNEKKTPLPDWLTETETGLNRLANAYIDELKPFAAVPGSEDGLTASGPCRTCDFAGVCRFKEWVGDDV